MILVEGKEHLIEKVRMFILQNTGLSGACLSIEDMPGKGKALQYLGDSISIDYYVGFANGCYTVLLGKE